MYSPLIIIIVIVAGLVAITSIPAGITVMVYAFVAMLVSELGLIPFIGLLIYWLVMAFAVEPFLSSITPFSSDVFSFFYWLFFVISIIYCYILLYFINSTIKCYKKIILRDICYFIQIMMGKQKY